MTEHEQLRLRAAQLREEFPADGVSPWKHLPGVMDTLADSCDNRPLSPEAAYQYNSAVYILALLDQFLLAPSARASEETTTRPDGLATPSEQQ